MRKILALITLITLVALGACRSPVNPPSDPSISVVLSVYLHAVEDVDVTVTGLFTRNFDPARTGTAPYPPRIFEYSMTPDGSALDRPIDGAPFGVAFDDWDVATGRAEGTFTVHQQVSIGGHNYECGTDFPCAVVVIQRGDPTHTYRQSVRLSFDD